MLTWFYLENVRAISTLSTFLRLSDYCLHLLYLNRSHLILLPFCVFKTTIYYSLSDQWRFSMLFTHPAVLLPSYLSKPGILTRRSCHHHHLFTNQNSAQLWSVHPNFQVNKRGERLLGHSPKLFLDSTFVWLNWT